MRILTLILLLLANLEICAQIYDNSATLTSQIDYSKDTLLLRIDNVNFFKNNEYFGKFAKGYTNIGGFIAPQFEYFPSETSMIKAGIHILTYSGSDRINEAVPILSLTTKLTNDLTLTIGTLNYDKNHKLSEPMFQFDKFYNNNTETGVQFLLNKKWVESDLWLDWENYIFTGDTTQEKFTAGNSTIFKVINKKHSRLSFPVQFTFNHIGGQINESDKKIKTFMNTYAGVFYEYLITPYKRISFEYGNYEFSYNLEEGELPFNKGYATYIRSRFIYKNLSSTIGYWNGHQYYSPIGEPLFFNNSHDKDKNRTDRDIFTGKITYFKRLYPGISFETRFETYYDFNYGKLDYSYTFALYFTQEFFIRKLKSRLLKVPLLSDVY